MSDTPWYPWYVGDARAKMRRLTLTERGAYRELLDEVYATREPLPADINELYLIAGALTEADRAAVDKVVARFFPLNGDGLRHNKRADKELAKQQDIHENLSERGKSGAAARWRKHATANATANASPMAYPQPQPQPHTTGTATPTSKTTSSPPADAGELQTPNVNPVSATRAKKPRAADAESKTGQTWTFYSDAYNARYGILPLRNKKVSGMLSMFVDRVGATEAPFIAAFYVTHRQSLYVRARHCVDLMLRDAEALRTEWATNTQVTATEAKLGDETAARGNVFHKLIKEIDDAE